MDEKRPLMTQMFAVPITSLEKQVELVALDEHHISSSMFLAYEVDDISITDVNIRFLRHELCIYKTCGEYA